MLLIYTAAKGEKDECGRATNLTDTAAIEKRQSCGRVSRSLQKRGFAHVFFGALAFLSKKYLKGPPRCDTPPACRYAPFTFALVFLSSANARFESPCFFQQKRHHAGAFFVERRSGDSPTQISAYLCSFLNLLKGPSSLRHATGVSLRTFHFCPSIPVFC